MPEPGPGAPRLREIQGAAESVRERLGRARDAAHRGPGRRLLAAVLTLALGACAQSPTRPVDTPQSAAPVETPSAAGATWTSARFRFTWPEAHPPAFHLDLLVGHCVVAPALAAHGEGIGLWRVHRRAARDAVGHQLTLWLRAPPAQANRVLGAVARAPMTARLQQSETVFAVDIVGPGDTALADIEDTSDRSWSPELQRAWPHFIMGVSATWLALIDEHARGAGLGGCDATQPMAEISERYVRLAEILRKTWREQGGHAFFHHISGVFGYDSLLLRF